MKINQEKRKIHNEAMCKYIGNTFQEGSEGKIIYPKPTPTFNYSSCQVLKLDCSLMAAY